MEYCARANGVTFTPTCQDVQVLSSRPLLVLLYSKWSHIMWKYHCHHYHYVDFLIMIGPFAAATVNILAVISDFHILALVLHLILI